MNFVDFIQKNNLKINGILSIGNTIKSEPDYLRLVSKDKITWNHLNKSVCEELKQGRINVYSFLLTDKDNYTYDFIVTNNDEFNSILEVNCYKNLFGLHEVNKIKLESSTIDTLFSNHIETTGLNMLTMDLQGTELLALKGADTTLHFLDVIYTKVNLFSTYKDCALVEEIDEFLCSYGFSRVETWPHDIFSSFALYIKKDVNLHIKDHDQNVVWDLVKHNVKTIVNVGTEINFNIENKSLNYVELNEKTNLDLYCMQNNYIDFLCITPKHLECLFYRRFLSHTNYIMFDNHSSEKEFYDFCKLVKSKGFNYIYLIGKNSLLYHPKMLESKCYYVAFRTSWKTIQYHKTDIQRLNIPLEEIKKIVKEKDLLVAVLTKNVGQFLPKILSNVEKYSSYFKSYRCAIIDGFSIDNTVQVAQKWCEEDCQNRALYSQTKVLPRPLSLADARNIYISLFEQYFNKDCYLLCLDADDVNITPVDEAGFLSCFDYPLDKWDMMSSNRNKLYYDIYALRSEECFWNYQEKIRQTGDEYTYLTKLRIPKPRSHPLVKVLSAFGGATIYKTENLKNCKYASFLANGRELCEHVIFNSNIKNGKLYINPDFITGD